MLIYIQENMEKINIAELLKNCPQGMELDCSMFKDVVFDKITDNKIFPICVKRIDGYPVILTKYGGYANCPSSKCVIFPKGKTTWEGFVLPCKFKDGDIIYVKDKYNQEWCSILSNNVDDKLYTYVDFCINNNTLYRNKPNILCEHKDIIEYRLATEKEKETLFNKIKDDDYHWNPKTKSLEKLTKSYKEEADDKAIFYYNAQCCDITNNLIKEENKTPKELIKPKFPVGVWVVDNCGYAWEIKGILNQFYILESVEGGESRPTIDWVNKTFKEVIKPRFRVGNRIRLKSKHNCIYTVFCLTWDNEKLAYKLLPDNDKHLILVSVNKQDEYELAPNKFDINTLIPFESKVLVRDSDVERWRPTIWGFYDNDDEMNYPYECIGDAFAQCIPFKNNEHLLGTNNDCDDFYKNWK